MRPVRDRSRVFESRHVRLGSARTVGMIPHDVRTQALHPFSTLPLLPGWRLVEGTHVFAALHPLPYPQPIEPRDGLTVTNVDAAIDEARTLVREHDREMLVWLAGPDHPWLADALARRGLRNEDSPGFESVENAMALVDPPASNGGEEVDVAVAESFDAFADGTRVELAAFDVPPEGRAKMEAELEARFAEYQTPANPFRRWNARLEGRVVGTAGAVLGDAGANLFGGGVLADARGRGVYRALVNARWNLAVQRGTPALTVQAGRMSRPVLERLGFEFIDAMQMYVDDFGKSAA
jgi:GNAT superfamily N-acetyltransferase